MALLLSLTDGYRSRPPERPLLDGHVLKRSWLPPGKRCAVVFTIDDVHPAKSTDICEAGGDLDKGALRHVAWLLEKHPELKVTLFAVPDWRQISPFPTRRLLAKVPILSEHLPLAPMLPKGTMRLDRHPEFVRYVKSLPRTDLAPHGLHHVSRRIGPEFQRLSSEECRRILLEVIAIFESAGLGRPAGFLPPFWDLTPPLIDACLEVGMRWVGGGRDLLTAPSDEATANMNGPRGVSMMHPTLIGPTLAGRGRLVHLTANFQATSDVDRAFAILDQGGVLSVKAHIVKRLGANVALDGMDEVYRAYLDALFRLIKERYGSSVWFASTDEIATRVGQTKVHDETCLQAI